MKKRQEGQAAVEMALTFPIILTIIATVFELGLMLNAYSTVVSAARHGAKAGAVYVFDTTESAADNQLNRESGTGTMSPYLDNVRDTVAGKLGALRIDASTFNKNSDVTISYVPGVAAVETRRGELISVRVVYHYQFLTGAVPLATIDLTGEATERIE